MQKKIGLVAIVRWEADHIAEWMEYHYGIGIDHFYIYINDESDEAIRDAIWRSRVPTGACTLYHVKTIGLQRQAYYHFLDSHSRQCDWFIFLDADEFIAVQTRDSVSQLLARLPADVGSYCMYWGMFGPNGMSKRTAGSVLNTYTKRDRYPNWHCKNFTRAAAVFGLPFDTLQRIAFWHCWGNRLNGQYRSVDTLGNDMASYWLQFPDQIAARVVRPDAAEGVFSQQFVAHYFIQSMDADRYRISRGTENDFASQAIWEQFRANGQLDRLIMDSSQVEDFSLSNAVSAVRLPQRSFRTQKPDVISFYDGQGLPRVRVTTPLMTGDSHCRYDDLNPDSCLNGAVRAGAQITIEGDWPYLSVVLDEPTRLHGVAVFLTPFELVEGQLLLVVDCLERATPTTMEIDVSSVFYRSLVPYLWINAEAQTVTKIHIRLCNRGRISLDQLALLAGR